MMTRSPPSAHRADCATYWRRSRRLQTRTTACCFAKSLPRGRKLPLRKLRSVRGYDADMEILIVDSATAAESLAARLIADRIAAKPDLVLGCATGKTMEGIYDRLVARHQANGLDFSAVKTFNLDEYVGLGPDDPHSYHRYMR